MPIPFILIGAAALTGAVGVGKGAKAISNNSEAKDIVSRAKRKYEKAEQRLQEQREITTESLDRLGKLKLDVWSGEMKDFVETFSLFDNLTLEDDVEINEKLRLKIDSPEMLQNMKIAAFNAVEVAKAGVASLGAGALAGIASYGGAMMFAAASTGTAIATLSGAAATNATLAWFGGGSLAAGGFGMAGGTLVLGGIVVGPVLAVAGIILNAKSEENLAKAKETMAEAKDAAAKMDMMKDFMNHVETLSDDYSDFIRSFSGIFRPMVEALKNIHRNAWERRNEKQSEGKGISGEEQHIDFNLLPVREQKTIHLAWLMAQVYYSVLTAPLLNENGEIDEGAYDSLAAAQDTLPEIEEKRGRLIGELS